MPLTRRDFGALLGTGLGALLLNAKADAHAALYPGEQIIDAAGFPSLVKFIKGDPRKPLVVFVPGTSFLARIAYGFPAGNDADFLAHWIVQRGYSFLGTSYPLANPVYDRVYPYFGVSDWGNQVVASAQHMIAAAGLEKTIIVIGWSMGGKPVETISRAAQKAGLDLRLFVALDALPPGPNLFPGNAAQFALAADGMVDQRDTLLPWFLVMIAKENAINGHIIIPPDVLISEFIGNPPLDVQGENARFSDGTIVSESASAALDAGTSDYDQYPPIALIVSDGIADYPNVLLSRSNWALFVGQQLYRTLIYPYRGRLKQLKPEQWQSLQRLFDTAIDHLTVKVAGTHFLFVGEKGARETAAAVEDLITRSDDLRNEILKIAEARHD